MGRQEEAADPKAKGLPKKIKNAEVALQRARDELATIMELCAPHRPVSACAVILLHILLEHTWSCPARALAGIV